MWNTIVLPWSAIPGVLEAARNKVWSSVRCFLGSGSGSELRRRLARSRGVSSGLSRMRGDSLFGRGNRRSLSSSCTDASNLLRRRFLNSGHKKRLNRYLILPLWRAWSARPFFKTCGGCVWSGREQTKLEGLRRLRSTQQNTQDWRGSGAGTGWVAPKSKSCE